MVKIRNVEFASYSQALVEFMAIPTDGDTAFSAVKSLKIIDSDLKIYNETRTKLCTDRCLKNEDGSPQIITIDQDGEKIQKYAFETPEIEKEVLEEIRALGEKEIEVNLERVPLYLIKNIKGITGILIYRLGQFIDETQSESPKKK